MTLFADTPPPRATFKLVVAYDGTDFHGFAVQDDVRTVGGVLAEAIEKMTRQPVELSCAGRTDAGVHAWGQVVSFTADTDLGAGRVQAALNGMLGPEIVVRSCDVVDGGFDARRAAQWRQYRYTMVNRPVPDPFLARYAWCIAEHLDPRVLQMAADAFIGEHDFAAFCRKGPEGSTSVRRVLDSRVAFDGLGVIRYEITATAFCWQMVRSIVGTLVDVGRGKRTAGDVLTIIRSRDRARAGPVAPPHGLCLWEVGYADVTS